MNWDALELARKRAVNSLRGRFPLDDIEDAAADAMLLIGPDFVGDLDYIMRERTLRRCRSRQSESNRFVCAEIEPCYEFQLEVIPQLYHWGDLRGIPLAACHVISHGYGRKATAAILHKEWGTFNVKVMEPIRDSMRRAGIV